MTTTETKIAAKLVDRILAKGWMISVWDGEDYAVSYCTDKAKIMKELGATDQDSLIVRRQDKTKVGSILLIWGNDEDLISDHSDNAETRELVAIFTS